MLTETEAMIAGRQAVVMADRRRSQRIISAWARAARRQYPSWAQMQEAELGDDWGWSFVVDLKRSVGFPYFIFLGPQLAKLSDLHLAGCVDWTMSVLDKAASVINDPSTREESTLLEDDITLLDNRTFILRCVTVPLADDGTSVTHILGAVSGGLKPR